MFGQRLAQIRKSRGLTQQDLAERMGAHYDQSTISKVEAGRRSLRLDGLIRASRALDVSIDYLVGESRPPDSESGIAPLLVSDSRLRALVAGAEALNHLVAELKEQPFPVAVAASGLSAPAEEPGPEAGAPLPEPPNEAVESDVARRKETRQPGVPVVAARFHPDVRGSAGHGEIVFEEAEGKPVIFYRDRLPLWARYRRLSCILAAGDSMEPTIQNGDFLALDPDDIEPIVGEIYAVRTGDGLVVKRLQRAGGRWNLESDNPAYPPRPMEEEDLIAGRVAPYGPLSAAAPASMEE